MIRSSARRARTRACAAFLLAASAAVLASAPGAPASAAIGDPTDSQVTASGTGAFSALNVTVSQTRDLIDEQVKVSWTGGAPTQPTSGLYSQNYLQIMQCWGDAAPVREQCQYGATAALQTSNPGGPGNTASRQLNTNGIVDPAETDTAPDPGSTNTSVPFHSVSGKTVFGGQNDFYDAYTTNEIDFGRTAPDGTGQQFFETQTTEQAPGLGCGDPQTDALSRRVGRRCWLVVIPRNDTEVDGSVHTGQNDNLSSSPLSATNWAHRITIPLYFAPLGIVCPIGSAEVRTVGQEDVQEAFNRWQPTLCANSGKVYGFSQVSDDIVRRQVASTSPDLGFVSQPIAASSVPAGDALVYTPVTLGAVSLAFNVERQSPIGAPDSVKQRDGQRFTSMNLTPRLVAKLLTQSYQCAAHCGATYLSSDARTLVTDPDFLQYNPDYTPETQIGLDDVITPLGNSDSTTELWTWVNADPDARAFLDGKPDPWGATVNQYYKGLALPRSDFPKSDPTCVPQTAQNGIQPAPICTLDAHPYAVSEHIAARAASRGDALATTSYDFGATPPRYKKAAPQASGQRALMAVADAASAARYGLISANLRNSAGVFVAPTEASLLAGLNQAKSSTVASGVVVPDPQAVDPAAYPLTTVTYAATSPQNLTAQQGQEYALMLRYAATGGQTPGVQVGDLPLGYAPLPAALRAATLSTADFVQSKAGLAVGDTATAAALAPAAAAAAKRAPSATVKAGPSAKAAAPPPAPVGGQTSPAALSGDDGAVDKGVAPALPGVVSKPTSPAVTPGTSEVPAAAVAKTAPVEVGMGRWAFVLALIVGAAALLGGPVLLRSGLKA